MNEYMKKLRRIVTGEGMRGALALVQTTTTTIDTTMNTTTTTTTIDTTMNTTTTTTTINTTTMNTTTAITTINATNAATAVYQR